MQEIADNGSLTKKQLLAIVELCNPTNKRIVDVAHKLQIGERTLFTWLKQPHFKERLQAQKKEIRDSALDMLKLNLNKAVIQLGALLDSQNETIKLKAALAVIEFNLDVVEQEELEKRVSALESEDNEYA